ncbi:signal peptidase [Leucobacter komagatae]|uniref:Signal peptidase I n=1 Tax=Leucobacter komagatae TaxID=55969 RepID=A0A542Y6W8_9MICO|nr:signal peptidase I [Leucobacter komagatae]TQL43838.1 signal peptidase [Leucobacter komagatae]
MTRNGRRVRGVAANALLNIAALGGALCIMLVLLGALMNVSIIMFKTGSMSPTIPAGSAALVREIPASDVRVGDVLTVDRPGQLPVTHRVTSIEGAGETRTITMRGDANAADDPAPYTIHSARLVVFSVPHLARLIVWFSNPAVLGALTVTTATLVTWAFWPKPRAGRRSGAPPVGPDAERSRPRHAAPMASVAIVTAALALGGAAGPLGADPALAVGLEPDPGESTVRAVSAGKNITLTSIGDPVAMRTMRPAVPVLWQVGVRVHSPDPGEVSVTLEAAGAASLGLSLDVRECDAEWVAGACPGTETEVSGDGLIDPVVTPRLVTVLPNDSERWFLIAATVPRVAAGTVTLTLRAAGGSEVVTAEPGPMTALPETGGRPPAWLLSGGAVALGLAAAATASGVTGIRRRRAAL